MEQYLTPEESVRAEYEINRSRFICTLAPCRDLEDGTEFVKKIRSEFSDATHNCYAIVGVPTTNAQKFSDDGEPSGTAGAPILNVLQSNKLQGVVAVVTRYFGGIKLGAGGLVSAYTKAVTEALEKAEIVLMKYSAVMEIKLTYGEYKNSKILLSDTELKVLDTEYADGVTITVAVPEEKVQQITLATSELTLGRTTPLLKDKIYIKYKR